MRLETITLKKMIDDGIKIFNFDYPYYREELKPKFEQEFIDYFLFDEIGLETPQKFLHRLKVQLNNIMPYWNRILESNELEQRILDNYQVLETYEKEESSTQDSTTISKSRNINSETPVTRIDINSNDYINDISKIDSEGNGINNIENKEKWVRKMEGNIGVQTDAEAVMVYWQSQRKIQLDIFKDLEVLFLGVYE